MLVFKHMCVASDSRTIVVVMLLFVENEYEIGKTVRSLGVSGVTHDYLTTYLTIIKVIWAWLSYRIAYRMDSRYRYHIDIENIDKLSFILIYRPSLLYTPAEGKLLSLRRNWN